ncbi:protein canopy homolog 2 isoform X2 [Apteryx mantelli]|uniref:Protein canopy homolog 2 isoform X2 n=1 Tax=Apteryx mantelli TaxID=2696672 RepID=A0ABM4FZA6_9AVES
MSLLSTDSCLSPCSPHCLLAIPVLSSRSEQPQACRALVDELEWEIAQVDPKKTIQMGSFRINPDGSQSVVEVPYARSEAHLTELLERVCEKMKEYGEKVDPSTHRKTYVRVISHDGTKMDLSGVKIDGDVASSLKFACESIAEEYEDELIEFLSHEAENVKDRLCSKRTEQSERGTRMSPRAGHGCAGCSLALPSPAALHMTSPLALGCRQALGSAVAAGLWLGTGSPVATWSWGLDTPRPSWSHRSPACGP